MSIYLYHYVNEEYKSHYVLLVVPSLKQSTGSWKEMTLTTSNTLHFSPLLGWTDKIYDNNKSIRSVAEQYEEKRI